MVEASESTVPSRRRGRGAVIVGLVAVVLLVGLVGADWYLRNREMSSLLNAIDRAEATTNRQLSKLHKVAERNSTEGPGRSEDWGDMELARFQSAAGSGRAAILVASSAVSDVRIAPWHRALRRARGRYRDHLRAWSTSFEVDATLSGNAYGPASTRAESDIEATWGIAEHSLRSATAPLALFDNDGRVDALFEDD